MNLFSSSVRQVLASLAGMIMTSAVLVHAGAAQALTVSPTTLQIQAGNTVTLNVRDASGEIKASTSDEDVATVKYDHGVVTVRGRSAGTATVTVRDRLNSRQVAVTVTPVPALTVSPTSIQLQVGNSANVTVTNANGEVRVFTSDEDVATVKYDHGVVMIRGRSAGTATVTVRDRLNSRQVAVTVTPAPALTVSPTSIQLQVGNSANVTVANANGEVRVSTSDEDVATANYENGIVRIRGRSAGTATVTVRDRLNSRQVAVTVTSGPVLTVSPTTVQVQAGNMATVNVTNANGVVTVSSSNTAIATVTYASGVATIRGVAAGTATITVRDSLNTRTVAVTVTAAPVLTVSPTTVQVQAGNTATVNVTNANGAVTVSSSNTAIATVTYASGVATVRGVAAGTATITIRDSLNTRTVAVTVTTAPAPVLTVSPTTVQVQAGNTANVTVTNANGAVTVSSSNTAIATVTYASGVATVRGVSAGSATVTISDSVTTRTVAVTVSAIVAGNYTLLAWNNLGMHCYDGNDYSIFSILPPLNTVNAQLVNQATGGLVTSGVTLTYQATADTTGSINSISSTKTNFWDYVQELFGLSPAPDVGLLGYPMASNTPAPMAYSAEHNWFEAVGIPITNRDDTNAKNDYPMIEVVAKNTAGQVLATTKVVLPVSDMLDCRNCHTSNNGGNAAANAARPAAGWVFDPDPLKDWKKNILRLHDEQQAGNPTFASALQAKGYPDGLLNSAMVGKPVLCVACHVSNAYQLEAGFPTGVAGIPPLTRVIHGHHANQIDPDNGMTLDDINNRDTCYHCHPGSVTQCLRGAMSGPDYQCQSCHSRMSHVGSASREGWLDLPNCQSCHHDGRREVVGVNSQGLPLIWSDTRFATNQDVPSIGARLYRYSAGHGGMKCEACHGSTHAEYPSQEANDNVQSIAVQGYAGTVTECSACHDIVPNTVTGGPHGMHPIGGQWYERHRGAAESATARAGCAYCHGADFRGSPLSRVKVAKTFENHSYAAGDMVGCYDCHNGPTGAIEPATRFADVGEFFDELMASLKSFFDEI